MSLEDVTDKIKARLNAAQWFNAKVKFDFDEDGMIFADATQKPAVVTNEDGEGDTTLICTLETFQKILAGQQDPNIAFMTGKLKIKGSMGVALKLNSILEE